MTRDDFDGDIVVQALLVALILYLAIVGSIVKLG
jgi:hypothetical protein